MTLWRNLFKGEYITAEELGTKRPTLTIADAKSVKLEGEDGRKKDKGVVFFKETDRGWVMCKTTASCCAAMFGDDTDGWKGKRVTLFSQPVRVGPVTKPGIRVLGSPDIAKPVTFTLKLPRKKPVEMKLVPTEAGKPLEPPPPPPGDDSEAAA